MTPIELARRLAQLGETKDALRAYSVALNGELTAREQLEAAVYTLKNDGDYKIAYSAFVGLYNAGQYRSDILPMMREAFLEPNIKLLKSRYERNCKALSKYRFLSRRDFPSFDKLPVVFFPFDDNNGYVPYDTRADSFLGFVNVKETVIRHHFFKDLEKPILASDVFSQYELEYLNDNVRKSEWCGRDNHIYLHYADWEEFCSYLTVLTLKPLLEDQKIVFLFGDELSDYPYDFKARYGIDYTKYPVEPFHIREVNRMIWHTQLSAHNGGDFFNEIFDDHPNLLSFTSVIMDGAERDIDMLLAQRESIRGKDNVCVTIDLGDFGEGVIIDEFYSLKSPTHKDALVAIYLSMGTERQGLDPNSRIAPALFFQPHFRTVDYAIDVDENGNTVLGAEELDRIMDSPLFQDFKYIKTLIPLRRFTTAYAATIRFMLRHNKVLENPGRMGKWEVVTDQATGYVLNRSFMRDPDNRLYRDAIVVRFEDGKLNPRATFPRLAAFLDIPYTESMTYCSQWGEHDVESMEGNAIGFDPRAVYSTYDEFVDDADRCWVEYFLRDAYAFYGYSFHYYDGQSVDMERAREWARSFTKLDGVIRDSWRNIVRYETKKPNGDPIPDDEAELAVEQIMRGVYQNRLIIAEKLLRGLRFLNSRNQPLSFIPMLEPDPALLDQPLYH